jgi:peptidoglycan/LPS O-acetylase OafA/YrhL
VIQDAVAVRPARVHIDAVDVVRLLTVAVVVGVHTVSIVPATVGTGAVVVLLHTSREVFFMLTAFVLVHSYGRGPVRWRPFWRRRALLVVAPYLAWSLVYFAASASQGQSLTPTLPTLGAFAQELLLGTAGYHLYFLLVSLQIYLMLPVIRWVLALTRRHHGWLLAVCATFQVLFSLAVQRDWSFSGIGSAWLHGPTAVLPSYTFYVAAGGVAAWHLDDLLRFTRRHSVAVIAGAAATLGVALAVYSLQVVVGHQAPIDASAVFQPVVVLESVGVAWAFLALGLLWSSKGQPRRARVMTASDASFGIYLCHPLLLQGLGAAMTATGVMAAITTMPAPLTLVILLGVLAPLTYGVCALLSVLIRPTAMSLVLTGRPRQQRARPSPVSTGHATVAASSAA